MVGTINNLKSGGDLGRWWGTTQKNILKKTNISCNKAYYKVIIEV